MIKTINIALPDQLTTLMDQTIKEEGFASRSELVRTALRSYFSSKQHDPDQAWFWTKEHQALEKEADEDIKNGDYEEFDSPEDLIKDLHSHL